MKIQIVVLFFLGLSVCTTQAAQEKKPLTKIRLALNWVPEPEFGGFYAAKLDKLYEKAGLDVELIPGGAGSPTAQLLASGQVEFAVSSGGEILISRSKGADILAVYNVYETSPLCIMTHRSRNAKSIQDVLSGGTLSIEKGMAFYDFLEKKIGFSKVKVVPYAGGIAQFLRDPMFSQQGFITAEPILAKNQGADPQSFLLADLGYNPYVAVVAVKESFLSANEAIVQKMVGAIREGWARYQKNPAPANQYMATLNKAMDLKTFDEAAKTQRALVQKDLKSVLGHMSEDRWLSLAQQLKEFKVLTKDIEVKSAFKNL